jgi:hypothetical protein
MQLIKSVYLIINKANDMKNMFYAIRVVLRDLMLCNTHSIFYISFLIIISDLSDQIDS